MHKFAFSALVLLVLLVFVNNGSGAADYEVEQVKSPYVEEKDIGQMMESEHSQHLMQRTSPILDRSYSSHRRKTRQCLSCQHGIGGSSLHSTKGGDSRSTSYGSSSSYSYGAASGSSGFNQPLQSSSRHELKKEQEFVNGQQVYDFHHEKKYQDGQLIDERGYEKVPKDFGARHRPSESSGYASLSSSGDVSHTLGYGGLPSRSYQESSYHGGMHHGSGFEPRVDDFTQQFQSEVERMREELHRKPLSLPAQHLPSNPTYGSSHRTEYRTQTKYVNGQPVYVFNEERKYKDGQLVHNVTEEKGPNELGTSNIVGSSLIPSSSVGNSYSAHRKGMTQSQYIPAASQPGSNSYSSTSEFSSNIGTAYRPSTYGSSSEQTSSASSYSSSSPTYKSGAHPSRHQTSAGYHPNLYQQLHDKNEDDIDDSYRQTHKQDSYEKLYGTIYGPSQNQYTNTQHSYDSARSHFSDDRPTKTTPKPSHYGYGTGRESYAARTDTYEEKQYQGNTYPHSGQTIKEGSQSSYFDSRRDRKHPDIHRTIDKDRVQVVDQDQTSHTAHYRPAAPRTSYIERQETETRYGAPSYESRINETSHSYQPGGIRETVASTREEESRRSSSSNYPSFDVSYRPGRYGEDIEDDDDKDDDLGRRVGEPTSSGGIPNYITGPEPEQKIDNFEEKERYDISPYADTPEVDRPEHEFDTNRVRYEEYPSHSTSEGSRSHSYEESESRSREHSTSHGYQTQRVTQESPDSNAHRGYSIHNTSRTDQRTTTIIPSRWVETRTTWKYINGRMVSETQHHRYYENGMLIHENTTQRTRDEMRDSGVDVQSLDLSPSQLAEYGQSLPSSSHSQKHEIYQVKRFKNGHQTYELNHERQFQDGVLVHENKEEKDEEDLGGKGDYGVTSIGVDDHLMQSHLSNHVEVGETGLGTAGFYQTTAGHPKAYNRKHEIRQKEEFVNGEKVYDLHHEREYKDGKLVRENKTELGPNDLGASTGAVVNRDALKDLISGRTHSLIGENALLEQRRTSDKVLSPLCLTCGTASMGSTHTSGSAASGHEYNSESTFRQEGSTHTSGSALESLGIPSGHGYSGGSTFRHDMEVEEHYENGQLVKGREESKKWKDGELVDAKMKHYYDGPSRAGSISTLSSGLDSTAAFPSVPIQTLTHTDKLGDKCAYNPCQNKGKCKTSVRGPVCVCPFGFRGSYCEEAYCPSRYCRYGGSCSVSESKHMCQCLEGYMGYRCSTRVHKIRVGVSG